MNLLVRLLFSLFSFVLLIAMLISFIHFFIKNKIKTPFSSFSLIVFIVCTLEKILFGLPRWASATVGVAFLAIPSFSLEVDYVKYYI